jgi:hypothetical protein
VVVGGAGREGKRRRRRKGGSGGSRIVNNFSSIRSRFFINEINNSRSSI